MGVSQVRRVWILGWAERRERRDWSWGERRGEDIWSRELIRMYMGGPSGDDDRRESSMSRISWGWPIRRAGGFDGGGVAPSAPSSELECCMSALIVFRTKRMFNLCAYPFSTTILG